MQKQTLIQTLMQTLRKILTHSPIHSLPNRTHHHPRMQKHSYFYSCWSFHRQHWQYIHFHFHVHFHFHSSYLMYAVVHPRRLHHHRHCRSRHHRQCRVESCCNPTLLECSHPLRQIPLDLLSLPALVLPSTNPVPRATSICRCSCSCSCFCRLLDQSKLPFECISTCFPERRYLDPRATENDGVPSTESKRPCTKYQSRPTTRPACISLWEYPPRCDKGFCFWKRRRRKQQQYAQEPP
mmetsp:Transcript_73803/g.207252  ORF Transcript_73803/g.207252 Transcript_73803/m.207252 type:complete len:238 (+) Transcript_73803:28-741(+)